MSINSGLIDAPPTRNPSISASLATSPADQSNENENKARNSISPTFILPLADKRKKRSRPGLTQLSAVLAVDASSVDDPDLVSDLLRDLAGHPFSERGVDLLSLLGGLEVVASQSRKPEGGGCRSSGVYKVVMVNRGKVG